MSLSNDDDIESTNAEYFGIQRTSNCYPIVSPFTLSHSLFPTSEKVCNQLGVPIGCYFTPFIDLKEDLITTSPFSLTNDNNNLARCDQCGGYINPYVEISSSSWYCSICGNRNVFNKYKTSRYRSSERKLLPELNENLIDFPVTFRTIEECPDDINGLKSVSIDKRPFVHIMIIEEDMNIDCIQTIVDSLIESIDCIHPDMSIILITFSYEISIYRFSKLFPTIQSIQLVITNNKDIIIPVDSLIDLVLLNEPNYHDCELKIVSPLSKVIDFIDLQHGLSNKTIRNAFKDSLNTIVDRLDTRNDILPNELRIKLIHTLISSIYQWIYNIDDDLNDFLYMKTTYDDIIDFNSKANKQNINTNMSTDSNQTNVYRNINSLFSSFTEIFLGGTDSDINTASDVIVNQKINNKSIPRPIDICTSVIVNLFISSHETSQSKHNLSSDIQNILTNLSTSSLTINIFEVNSFESDHYTSGINQLYRIVESTGGNIFRYILGSELNHQKNRLVEQICRLFNDPTASRCISKIRITPGVTISDDGITGFVSNDDKHKGVFRMNSCRTDKSISFHLRYLPSTNSNVDPSNSPILVMSYETLSESELDQNESNEYTDNNYYESSTIQLLNLQEYLDIQNNIINNSNSKRVNNLIDNNDIVVNNKRKYRRSCRFDFNKRLIVCRRLRVITAVSECTNSVPRLIHAMNASCISGLITNTILISYLKSSDYESAIHDVLIWLTSLVASTSILLINHNTKFNDQNLSNEDIRNSLQEITQMNKIHEICRLLFGLCSLLHKFHNNVYCISDAIHVIFNFLTMSPYYNQRVLYPVLLPIKSINYFTTYSNDNNKSNEKTLILSHLSNMMSLKRESIVMNNSELFLIDSGFDCIIYRPISSYIHLSSMSIPSAINQYAINNNTSSNINLPKQVVKPKDSDVYIIRSSYWLPNTIVSRVYLSPYLLNTFVIEAGTQSAGRMNELLIEDNKIIVTINNEITSWNDLSDFIQFIINKTLNDYYSS